jgi:hypothetical protein
LTATPRACRRSERLPIAARFAGRATLDRCRARSRRGHPKHARPFCDQPLHLAADQRLAQVSRPIPIVKVSRQPRDVVEPPRPRHVLPPEPSPILVRDDGRLTLVCRLQEKPPGPSDRHALDEPPEPPAEISSWNLQEQGRDLVAKREQIHVDAVSPTQPAAATIELHHSWRRRLQLSSSGRLSQQRHSCLLSVKLRRRCALGVRGGLSLAASG